MSDVKAPSEAVQADKASPSPARKTYSAPKLTKLGSLADLTKGGDQEQRGEGPGFSL